MDLAVHLMSIVKTKEQKPSPSSSFILTHGSHALSL